MLAQLRLQKYTAAYSLIELLVTTIVFSVGMLGFGVLQIESLKKSNESHLKSIASIQAADIVDRIKSNPEALQTNYYDDTSNSTGVYNLECLGGVEDIAYKGEKSQTVSQTSCDSEKMAEIDLYQWKTNLSNVLPNGTGDICKTNNINATNCNQLGDVYVITISWTDIQGATKQYRVGFTP